MPNKLLIFIVFFFVLGSISISSMDVFSYTFKSIFNIVGMGVLIVIGLVYLFKKAKDTKE